MEKYGEMDHLPVSIAVSKRDGQVKMPAAAKKPWAVG